MLEYFREEGGDWQSKIDDALKAYILEHPNTVKEGQKRLKHRISAVKQITEMFLEDLYSDSDPLWNSEGFSGLTEDEKLRIAGVQTEKRHSKIIELLGEYGLDNSFVLRLFVGMEYKAIGEMNKLMALVQTIEPDQLKKYGVPDVLIENAKAVKGYEQRKVRSAGGKGKAQSFNKATKDKVEIEWKKWRDGERKCKGKAFNDYGAQSAFAGAMISEELSNSFDVAKGWDREWRKKHGL